MSAGDFRIGFIGLGAMGWPMAAHFHRAGWLKAVYNRSRAKCESFVAVHPTAIAASITALKTDCNVIFSCVTADRDVLVIAEALVEGACNGLVHIDTSTIASASAIEAAVRLAEQGGSFIDAPVSGGVEGAKNAALSVMVGGDAETVARIKPLFGAIAARVVHMGEVGSGQNTKAVNQVLVAGIAEAVCEGLALGKAMGLDALKLLPVLQAGAANAWFLEKRGASMLQGMFSTGFKAALLRKDLAIVQGLCKRHGVDHPIVDRALTDYAKLVELGFGDEDISTLIRLKSTEYSA